MTVTRAALGAISVVTRSGERVALGSLFGDGPVVLVFLRHYACPSCSRVTHAFLDRAREIDALGARLIVIGVGSVDAMGAFMDATGLGSGAAIAVTDPERAAHALAGMARSAGATYGPRAVLRSLKLYLEGHHRPRRDDDGDVEQQGGVLVLDPADDAAPLYAWRSRFVGDDCDASDVLALLLARVAAQAPLGT